MLKTVYIYIYTLVDFRNKNRIVSHLYLRIINFIVVLTTFLYAYEDASHA